MNTVSQEIKGAVEKLFGAGAHYGYAKARRHPSAQKFVFGAKNGVDIFDLERSAEALAEATAFVEALAASGKQLLFVGGKLEAREIVRAAAESVNQPFVASRWVGGTLSNFALIRKRVERMLTLESDKEAGQLSKYTKKERLLIDRDIKRLDETFGGLRDMKSIPGAMFIIDPRYEKNAVREAAALHIPIVALANTDCDMNELQYPIPGNDASVGSMRHFTALIAEAYRAGATRAPVKAVPPEKSHVSAPETERGAFAARKPRAPRA